MPKLRRTRDGAGDIGARSESLKLNHDKTSVEIVGDRPMVGAAMLVGSVTARSYSWQDFWLTTVVTEIIEDRGDYVKFKTGNSIYEWWE